MAFEWPVVQVSKPAVSPISKSADRRKKQSARGFGNPRYSRFGNLRYYSSVKCPDGYDGARLDRGTVSRSNADFQEAGLYSMRALVGTVARIASGAAFAP